MISKKVLPVFFVLCLLVTSVAQAQFPLFPRRRARLAVDRFQARSVVASTRHASPLVVRNGIFVPHVTPVIQQRVIVPSQFFVPVVPQQNFHFFVR